MNELKTYWIVFLNTIRTNDAQSVGRNVGISLFEGVNSSIKLLNRPGDFEGDEQSVAGGSKSLALILPKPLTRVT